MTFSLKAQIGNDIDGDVMTSLVHPGVARAPETGFELSETLTSATHVPVPGLLSGYSSGPSVSAERRSQGLGGYTNLSDLAAQEKLINRMIARANCVCCALTHAQTSYNKTKVVFGDTCTCA